MIFFQKKGKVSRKGFVYTLFVISFIFSVMLFISMQKNSQKNSEFAEKIRADEVLSFAHSISGDIGRSSFISGKRSLLALTNTLIEGNGTYEQNANISAKEVYLNGTLNEAPLEIMKNSTFTNWTAALQSIGNGQRMIVQFSVKDVNIVPSSAFEIAFKNNVSVYIYDPFTKITYNKTMLSVQDVPLDLLEDPYIAIKSLGTASNTFKKCPSFSGNSSGNWVYGIINASTQTDFGGGASDQILVTDTIVGKSNYGNFKGVVTETETDVPVISTYIVGVPVGTLAASKNGSYAVISKNNLWLTNDTSCYFEAPEGPSFFDRLEGRGYMSPKYNISEKITGLGSFVWTFSEGRVLDYDYYG